MFVGGDKELLARLGGGRERSEEQDDRVGLIPNLSLTYDFATDSAEVERRLPQLLEAFRRRVRDYEERRAA
jgi:hypothetical protein